MLAFFLGVMVGLLAFFSLIRKERRRVAILEEEARLIQQEKLIVVDFMHHMVEALGEGLSKNELYQRIVHASIVSTGALSACVFDITERGTLKGVAVEGLFPPHRPLPEGSSVKLTTRAKFIERILLSEEFPLGDGIVGGVARSGKVELIADGLADQRIVKHDDPALVVRTVICAPIKFRDRAIGVLSVCNSSDGKPFTQTDVSLVRSIAEQAGMAIHNNEFLGLQVERKQLDVDLALARDVQQMLLPAALPCIEGVDMDARYIAAQQVGGDLYDVIDLGSGKFAVAVADVSGKGMAASLVMAICRANLRHFATAESSPAEVLKNVNRSLSGEIRQEMYVTMIYAVFDVSENRILYARAGHEPAILCSTDKARNIPVTESLFSEGMPVGLVDSEIFNTTIEERSIPFEPGDIFVAFTDGLTETRDADGREFSSSRLADEIRVLRKRPSAEINQGLLENVNRYSGSQRYGDDLTLVTVKRV